MPSHITTKAQAAAAYEAHVTDSGGYPWITQEYFYSNVPDAPAVSFLDDDVDPGFDFYDWCAERSLDPESLRAETLYEDFLT